MWVRKSAAAGMRPNKSLERTRIHKVLTRKVIAVILNKVQSGKRQQLAAQLVR